MSSLITAQAQTTYKKRILIYGPTLHNGATPSEEDQFINSHPNEFEPIQTGTPGKSAIWGEQQWINATVADFQQFDAIVFSDKGTSTPNWSAALATRAIWGSAINGNIFITSGDPINDGAARVFRQGTRFAALQSGNAHGRTGLYIALDHLQTGEQLNMATTPTELPILSWFGSFKSVTIGGAFGGTRLIGQNPTMNVLGASVGGYSGSIGQGFHSWPEPFVPIAYRFSDANPTPANAPFYFAPCEAGDNGVGDGGYRTCASQNPLVYILAKSVGNDITRLAPAQCNMAVSANQPCNFSAHSMIALDLSPNNPSGPSTQVSWRVVSGPNVGLSGFCTRQFSPYGYPINIWSASYNFQGTVVDPNNSQDVVQLFLDYPQNGNPPNHLFNDMSDSADPNDPNDPAPGKTIEYGTTFTVNWGAPQVSVVKLPTPAAAAEPATSAFFRVSRTGSTAALLPVAVCFSGTALPNCSTMTTFDYVVRINGIIFSVNPDLTFTTQIPQNLAYVDVEIVPVDDLLAEGTETVRMALKDVFNGSYVVGGQGFAQLDILDNDQPVVIANGYVNISEQTPQTPGTWIVDTASPLTQPLKVYFTFGGTADMDVDYVTSLIPADDTDPSPAILLPSGIGRVIIDPATGSPFGSGHHAVTFNLAALQDSRTEGTESATITLLAHPSYKLGSPSSGSVSITDDDSPKIPLGYTIRDLGDASHITTTAAGINNNINPLVVGTHLLPGSLGIYQAFSWNNGSFTDIAPLLPPPTQSFTVGQAINDGGLVTGSAASLINGSWLPYYYVSDSLNTLQLQTPSAAALYTGPRAINNAGWVVGEAMNAGFGVFRAARWDAASGNFLDLRGLSQNPEFSSFAWALSSSVTGHRVAGESRFDLNINAITPALHAFRTQPGTEPQQVFIADDLGNLLASETSSSGSRAINSLSEIVGYTAFSATEQRASYKDGNSGKNKGWRTFGVLSGGSGAGLSALALGLNDVGLVVGWSRSSTGYKAVVWENYQAPVATDLNLKIYPVAVRANWVLQYATGINSSGKIVGYGLKNGSQRAFLLTPLP